MKNIYSLRVRDFGSTLLHQQCWCFGRDILHPEGNLLIREGYERYGVPDGGKGSNCYRKALPQDGFIYLWGFGAAVSNGSGGAIFIGRYEFAPIIITNESGLNAIHLKEELPPHTKRYTGKEKRAATKELRRLFREFADYEDHILKLAGSRWRTHCLREFEYAKLTSGEIRGGWRSFIE